MSEESGKVTLPSVIQSMAQALSQNNSIRGFQMNLTLVNAPSSRLTLPKASASLLWLASGLVLAAELGHAQTVTTLNPNDYIPVGEIPEASEISLIENISGIGGYVVEDFEDCNFSSGVMISPGCGEYAGACSVGGIGTNVTSIDGATWGGTNGLMFNLWSQATTELKIEYAGGAKVVAFGVSGIHFDHQLIVNGANMGSLQSLENGINFASNQAGLNSRNLFLRIEKTSSPITLVQIVVDPAAQTLNGDCVIIDHLAIIPDIVVGAFCNPMTPNCVGTPSRLVGHSSSDAGSCLHLDALDGPPNQFGYFLIGTAPDNIGTPLGNGRLCLAVTGGNLVRRYNIGNSTLNSVGQFDPLGVFQNSVGTSASGTGYDVPLDVPGSGSIAAGQTWYFQLWHRDVCGLGSNFTNGVMVTF